MARRRAQLSAQKSARKEYKPRGRPFQPGNPWRIKKGEVRNPGGRPRLLSDAYKEWLAAEDETGVTNAARLALAAGEKGIHGDISAIREIRQTTEGDTLRLTTWQQEIVDALKKGELSPQQVIDGLGIDDARALLIAAGQAIPEGASGAATPGA